MNDLLYEFIRHFVANENLVRDDDKLLLEPDADEDKEAENEISSIGGGSIAGHVSQTAQPGFNIKKKKLKYKN